MVDDVCRRLRINKKQAKTVHFGLGYSKDVGGGFARQMALAQPSNIASNVYRLCLKLMDNFYDNSPIRSVRVAVTNLSDESGYQVSLFEDIEAVKKEQDLFSTVDKIQDKFGKSSVTRASSELESSTLKSRNKMIGGHNA